MRNIKLKKGEEDEKRKVRRNNEHYELHFVTNELFFLSRRIQLIADYENVLINPEKLKTGKVKRFAINLFSFQEDDFTVQRINTNK